MTNAVLNMTADSYWGLGGLSWTNEPSGLGDIAASVDSRVYSFNPSNSTPTSYVIRAWAGALTNCTDTATVNVYRIELSPSATNVCWRMTNEVSMEVLNSYTPNGVTWSGTNGLRLVSVSDQKLVFTPTNSPPTNYMVVAAVTGYTNCYDTSTVNVLKVESVELVSGATADDVIPPHTWATIKNTNAPTEYVVVRAEIEPNIDPASLPAGFISWSGGQAVATNQLQRKVPKNISAHTELVASCGGSSATGHVWVIWSEVTVRHTDNKTAYDSDTDTGNSATFPPATGGQELGPANRLTETEPYLGWKVEAKGILTPAGIHEVVQSGWDFYQTFTYADFFDPSYGTNAPYASGTDTPDAEFNAGSYPFKDRTPDSNEAIYALDGPGVWQDFSYYKSTDNFSIWVRWHGTNASDSTHWWIRQKVENQSGTYVVIENGGGNGTTTIDFTY